LNYTRAGEHEDTGRAGTGSSSRHRTGDQRLRASRASYRRGPLDTHGAVHHTECLGWPAGGRWPPRRASQRPLSPAYLRPGRECPACWRSRCRWFLADAGHGDGIRARLPSRADLNFATLHGLSGSSSPGIDASLRVHATVTAGKQVGNGAVGDW